MPEISHPDCPLCPENGKVKIVMETPIAYLALAKFSPIEGCYLIVPKEHITDIMLLSRRWQAHLRALLAQVPWYHPDIPFNLSINSGEAAGQTLSHLHFWAIPRTEPETAASHGKGTATLIDRLNKAIPVST